MSVKIRGTIKQWQIEWGERQSFNKCPLALSLEAKGMTNLKISSDSLILDHPKKGGRLITALSSELRAWIRDFDSGRPVEPIHYELELE